MTPPGGGRGDWTGGAGRGSGIPGLDDAPLPTCYRHPDRETGVSCANCGRPICPDCMTPAAVGFRCPECMRAQRHEPGRARVITRAQTRDRWRGGMLGSGGLSVTKVLVGINVIAFIIEMVTGAVGLMGGGATARLVDLGALVPYDVLYDGHQYWRLLTAMFLHGSVLHIAFNMWALLAVGDYLETALGRLRFLLVYFISGLAGSVLVVVTATADDPVSLLTPTVGASGAIFGVFAALFVYAYLDRHRDLMARMLVRNMAFVIVINMVITFSIPGISWQGHVGGLLAGAAVTAALTLGGRKDVRGSMGLADGLLVAAIVAVIAVALVLKVQAAASAPITFACLWLRGL